MSLTTDKDSSMPPDDTEGRQKSEPTFLQKLLEQISGKPFLAEDKKSLTAELRNVMSAFQLEFAAVQYNAPPNVIARYKEELVDEVVASGVLAGICQTFIDGDDVVRSNETSIGVIMDMTDSSQAACEVVCSHTGFLEVVAKQLVVMSLLHISGDRKGGVDDFAYLIGIVHNCLTKDVEAIRHRIRELDFTKVLIPYLGSPVKYVRLIALSTLADIVDEDESAILKANPNIIKDLMSTLQGAMASPDRHMCGWSPAELARTIRQIARNDTNKKLVVEHGCLPLLVKLAKRNDLIEETQEAVKALWALAFDTENRKQMVENNSLGVVEILTALQSSPDKEVSKACRGALWTLDEKKRERETSDSKEHEFTGHIMLSYQWNNQSLLKEICSNLQSYGYKVWMDIDQMGGSTLQAMAEAVENSIAVLICASQKYKDSPNCRAEAEYAFEKRKTIIPLVLENGYRADGWLGMIMGTKLRFDFSGKYPFETKIKELEIEIRRSCSRDDVDTHKKQPTGLLTASLSQKSEDVSYFQTNNKSHQLSRKVAANWTSDQLMQWLDRHDLSREKFGYLSGRELDFLRNMCYRAPESYYKTLRKTLHINDLLTMAAFTEALEDL